MLARVPKRDPRFRILKLIGNLELIPFEPAELMDRQDIDRRMSGWA